jgi:hypothetical protein
LSAVTSRTPCCATVASTASASIPTPAEARAAEATSAEQQVYANAAYPFSSIGFAQVQAAQRANARIHGKGHHSKNDWQEIGPYTLSVDKLGTQTGLRDTQWSGRVTALAIDQKRCDAHDCRMYVAAAGGGVWRSNNALSSSPDWKFISGDIPSTSIGSLLIDPTDRSGKTLYAGTGEESGSSDSEAGVGLYESTNGGATFTANTIKPQDTVDPTSPTGNDFERGGVTTIKYDPSNPSNVYFSMIGYGLYRSTNNGSSFARIYTGTDPGNPFGIRYEFDFARLPNGKTRIYLADGRDEVADNNGNLVDASQLFRIDDASVPASSLTNDDDSNPQNPGWKALSSPSPADPGFGSWDFCEAQCSYDMWVASPPGQPNEVWLGGSMHYDELPPYAGADRSDGRAVVRSTDAGVSWTDMTGDARAAWEDQHPDTRDVAFVPGTHIAFVGSDGGVIRTNGTFSNASAQCDTRGLSGNDLVRCHEWLSGVPTRLIPVNSGLRTLQFESLTANRNDPLDDVIGGTQDNSTMAYSGSGTARDGQR